MLTWCVLFLSLAEWKDADGDRWMREVALGPTPKPVVYMKHMAKQVRVRACDVPERVSKPTAERKLGFVVLVLGGGVGGGCWWSCRDLPTLCSLIGGRRSKGFFPRLLLPRHKLWYCAAPLCSWL